MFGYYLLLLLISLSLKEASSQGQGGITNALEDLNNNRNPAVVPSCGQVFGSRITCDVANIADDFVNITINPRSCDSDIGIILGFEDGNVNEMRTQCPITFDLDASVTLLIVDVNVTVEDVNSTIVGVSVRTLYQNNGTEVMLFNQTCIPLETSPITCPDGTAPVMPCEATPPTGSPFPTEATTEGSHSSQRETLWLPVLLLSLCMVALSKHCFV